MIAPINIAALLLGVAIAWTPGDNSYKSVQTGTNSPLDYDPRVLTITWADGSVDHLAATSPATRNAAVLAIARGLWAPVGVPVASAHCDAGNLFSERSLCIIGHNCPAGARR